MRNHEYYKDPTAYQAIRRVKRRKKKTRPWGGRLTYRIGTVINHNSIKTVS